MADELTLTVRTFRAGTDKEAARKIPEEAAEAFAEWVIMTDTEQGQGGDHRLDDELADCVTACANLAARYGLDLQEALSRVEARNRERGRYGGRAKKLVEPDPETDGATGRCSCGACGGPIDVQDRWCRWCGTELMGG